MAYCRCGKELSCKCGTPKLKTGRKIKYSELLKGKSIKEVSVLSGYSRTWVLKFIKNRSLIKNPDVIEKIGKFVNLNKEIK